MTEAEKKMQDELTELMKENHKHPSQISLEASKGIKLSGWVDDECIDPALTNFQMYTIMYFMKHRLLARPSTYWKEQSLLSNLEDAEEKIKYALESRLKTCFKCCKFRTSDCLYSSDSRNGNDIPNPMYACSKYKNIKANK